MEGGILSRLRPYGWIMAVVVVGCAWAFAFLGGWAGKEWPNAVDSGAISPLRGSTVPIGNRLVETAAEREARLRNARTGILAGFNDAKKEILGNRTKTLGNDIPVVHPELPDDVPLTRRERCLNLRLSDPDRFRTLDCSAPEFDEAPR